MKTISLAVLVLALLAGVSGCETVKGMGRDIEKAGEGIQKSAD
ncbi:MAG: entericidin A/B family lipoprotein [Pseudomonadota bacterium]